MKQTAVQITFEIEKLNALKFFMKKKEANLTSELDNLMQKLYEKYVPQPAREYIEGCPKPEPARPPRKPKPKQPAPKAEPPATIHSIISTIIRVATLLGRT